MNRCDVIMGVFIINFFLNVHSGSYYWSAKFH